MFKRPYLRQQFFSVVDCRWSLWSTCSTTENCAGGIQTRQITREAKNGGKDCLNKEETERPCNRIECPVIGKTLTLKRGGKGMCPWHFQRLTILCALRFGVSNLPFSCLKQVAIMKMGRCIKIFFFK